MASLTDVRRRSWYLLARTEGYRVDRESGERVGVVDRVQWSEGRFEFEPKALVVRSLSHARAVVVPLDQVTEVQVGDEQIVVPEAIGRRLESTTDRRVLTGGAEIALHAETPETAVEWARRATEIAQRTRRRKYESRSLTILGEALGQLGRRDEALAALRTAVALADELIGQPGRWRAREVLGRVSHLVGEDDAAAAAYAEAGDLIESFAATLAPPRSGRFLAAPVISQILALAGRTPAA